MWSATGENSQTWSQKSKFRTRLSNFIRLLTNLLWHCTTPNNAKKHLKMRQNVTMANGTIFGENLTMPEQDRLIPPERGWITRRFDLRNHEIWLSKIQFFGQSFGGASRGLQTVTSFLQEASVNHLRSVENTYLERGDTKHFLYNVSCRRPKREMLSLVPTHFLKLVIYVPLLALNALAILNEDRFLVVIGWSYSNTRAARNSEDGHVARQQKFNARWIDLIHASQFMRSLTTPQLR
ncbi:hypothetical protein C8F04DRAFT_1201281 [Mycena alexandri]|uniref:Uncharacterized protein n=1 Tax=Mycena alexandri TaxID=1745969 RepID=A0AAD6RYI3_9AGAR|nr:hypothetical protein C8F04DRAFT_1201281 [Mycena alexandri]